MSFAFFDRIYCIHLPHQTDRMEHIRSELKKINVNVDRDVTFVHASPPARDFSMSNFARNSVGEFGCNLSQITAVVRAIKDGAQRPLFIEDDIFFTDDATDRLDDFLHKVPHDWDILYFGGHPRGDYTLLHPNVAKVSLFSFAEAYSISGEFLFHFFQHWADNISKPKAPFDFILGNYASKVSSYCIHPIITKQVAGVSGISGKYEDKTKLLTSRWEKWKS